MDRIEVFLKNIPKTGEDKIYFNALKKRKFFIHFMVRFKVESIIDYND